MKLQINAKGMVAVREMLETPNGLNSPEDQSAALGRPVE